VGVIALGATGEFSRSRTARVPRQGYTLAPASVRASERIGERRVFASLMLTNEGYIIIGENGQSGFRLSISQPKRAVTILQSRFFPAENCLQNGLNF
jgi:hypothetical protein